MTKEVIQHINDAIGVHGLWLSKLQSAIKSGTVDISAQLASRPSACKFGKWLDGDSFSPTQKASFAFMAVRELHREFHQIAGLTVGAINRGNLVEAENALTTEFTKASGKLVRALRMWKKDIRTRGL